MTPIRILVVDDSAVIRRLVTEALNGDPELEVVGTAANGHFALQKLPQLQPDLVTLDLDMPEMDGLQTLGPLRRDYPHLPVIMFSAQTRQGAASTLKALALGASDYITKPSGTGSLVESMRYVREALIPRIKALVETNRRRMRPPTERTPAERTSTERTSAGRTPTERTSGERTPGERPSAERTSAERTPTASSPPARRSVPSSFDRHAATAQAPHHPLPTHAVDLPPLATGPIDIVAIGISTGGPNALAHVLPALPASFPVPIVIVQHMPPVFTQMLAESLDGRCALRVREAVHGASLTPGTIWIAPGDYHLAVKGPASSPTLVLNQDAPENFCRPAVDVLFRSVAHVFGNRALAVVMTGMGNDGARSAEVLRRQGCPVLIQDEASSVVWGMPGAVARAGLAEAILPLDQIAPTLTQYAARARRAPTTADRVPA